MTLALHITIQSPPAGLHYGLQKGHGGKFEIEQIQHSTGQDLHFDWVIDIKGEKQKDSAPGFGGPFVQGGVQFLAAGVVGAGVQITAAGRVG